MMDPTPPTWDEDGTAPLALFQHVPRLTIESAGYPWWRLVLWLTELLMRELTDFAAGYGAEIIPRSWQLSGTRPQFVDVIRGMGANDVVIVLRARARRLEAD